MTSKEVKSTIEAASKENKKLYPIKFYPEAEKISWGGNYLVKTLKKRFTETDESGFEKVLGSEHKIGFSWEIADMGFRDSVVSEGWLKGNTLSDLMETYFESVVGEHVFQYYGRQFPVVAKWIDTRKRTPLMVCPDDKVAAARYDSLGKTKLWYIQEVNPGCKLFLGFKEKVSASEFYKKCMDGTIEELLNVIVPKKGESFLISPGLVHGIVGPMRVCEVAEASDLDFKIHNWGQPTENDSVEQLGIVEAFDFINYNAYADMLAAGEAADRERELSKGHHHEGEHHDHECSCGHHHEGEHHDHECSCGHHHEGEHHDHECSCGHHHEGEHHHFEEPEYVDDVTQLPLSNKSFIGDKKIVNKLASCPEFSVTQMNLTDPLHIYSEKFGSFIIYTCLEGEASLQVPSHNENKKDNKMKYYSLRKGETILVPADIQDFLLVPIDRGTMLLESLIERREFADPYINQDVEAELHDDDEDDDKQISEAPKPSPFGFFGK